MAGRLREIGWKFELARGGFVPKSLRRRAKRNRDAGGPRCNGKWDLILSDYADGRLTGLRMHSSY